MRVFVAPDKFCECRKTNHQVVHGSPLPIYVDCQRIDAPGQLREVGSKQFDMTRERFVTFSQAT
jgi:hypothetical protein